LAASQVNPTALARKHPLQLIHSQLHDPNIVEIFSVKRSAPLQPVVMPYDGSTTSADVIRGLRGSKSLPAAGPHLVADLSELNTVGNNESSSKAGCTPAKCGRPPFSAPDDVPTAVEAFAEPMVPAFSTPEPPNLIYRARRERSASIAGSFS
jgi:hypothetical protein